MRAEDRLRPFIIHLLVVSLSAGTRSSTAHTTTVWSRGWSGLGWERFVVSKLVVLIRQTLAGTRSSTTHTTTVWSRGWGGVGVQDSTPKITMV